VAKESSRQVSYNSGLLSPQIAARTDLDKYFAGGEVLDNFLPLVEGPLVRRPGLKFIAPQGDEDFSARMVRFEFSVDQSYALEFGQNYMRVYRDQGLVLDSLHTPASITDTFASDPYVLKVDTTGLATGDMVFITGTDVPEINGQFFDIDVISGSDLSLVGVDGTTFSTQSSPVGTLQLVYSIATPYTAAQVREFQSAPSADVMYIAHGNVPRQKVSRLADDDWTIVPVDSSQIDVAVDDEGFVSWPPFAELNSDPDLQLWANGDANPGADVTIKSIDAEAVFTSADVGRFLMLQATGTELGYGKIKTFTNTDEVIVTVYSRFPNGLVARFPDKGDVLGIGEATEEWAFSAFDTINKYPVSVASYETRLYWASPSSQVSGVWGSVSGDLENHRVYGPDPASTSFLITPESAFLAILSSERVDAVVWMVGLDDVLVLGTRGGEWTLQGDDPSAAISAANVGFKPRGRVGSRKFVEPAAIDNIIMFVQRAGRKLKEHVFDLATQSYKSPDMTRLSREVTFGRILYLAYQQEPNRVIWAVMEDGTFASMTYEREDGVVAWCRHPVGGSGFVESATVISDADEDEDEVWVTVKRTIDGRTRRFIEVMQKFWERGDDVEDAFYADGGSTYSGSAITEIYGFLHMIGETMDIASDGFGQDAKVVDSKGRITLDIGASKVHAGFSYDSKFKSMRVEAGALDGTAAGKVKRIHRLVIRLDQCGPDLEFGIDFIDMDKVFTRNVGDPVDEPVVLFDGDTESKAMPGGYNQEGYVAFRYSKPFPCSIVAHYPQLVTRDRD